MMRHAAKFNMLLAAAMQKTDNVCDTLCNCARLLHRKLFTAEPDIGEARDAVTVKGRQKHNSKMQAVCSSKG